MLVETDKSSGSLLFSSRIVSQGLRLNRVLVALDLSGNQLADAALVAFGELVTQFELTHEEVVQRRAMLSLRKQAASSRGARSSSAHLSFAAMSALLRSVVRCVLRSCYPRSASIYSLHCYRIRLSCTSDQKSPNEARGRRANSETRASATTRDARANKEPPSRMPRKKVPALLFP